MKIKRDDEDDEIIMSKLSPKSYYNIRRRLSVISLFFALIGIVFAVTTCELETQLWAKKVDAYANDSKMSRGYPSYTPVADNLVVLLIVLKFIVTISTIFLLIFITIEYIIKLHIARAKNEIKSFLIGVRPKFIFMYLLEILICGIHPPPIELKFFWGNPMEKNIGMTRYVPVYTILTLFTFSRLYLVARCAMLYSKFKKNHGVKTIAKLNQVELSYYFIFKSFMNLYPGKILCFFLITFYIWCCWAYRVCEMNPDENLNNGFQRSMWLVAVTFLTIGYGDITPETMCGRGVAIITGLLGVCFTALVIAVLSQSLELTREEKRTQDFLLQGEYETRIRYAASRLIRAAWLHYRMNKTNAPYLQVKMFERSLYLAVDKFKRVRKRKINVIEQSLGIIDIYHESLQIHQNQVNQMAEIKEMKKALLMTMDRLERTLQKLNVD